MFNRGAIINVRNLGHHAIDSVLRLGYATRFIGLTLLHSGTSFRRVNLIVRDAGHDIQQDKPQTVIGAIVTVLDMAATRQPERAFRRADSARWAARNAASDHSRCSPRA